MSTQNRLKVSKSLEGPVGGCINLSADYLKDVLVQDIPDDETVCGPNIVENGDFSDGLTGWTSVSGSSLSLETSDFVSHEQSGKVTTPSGDAGGGIDPGISLDADTPAAVTFWAKSVANTEYVQFFGGSFSGSQIPITSDWLRYEVEFERDTVGGFQIIGYYPAADAEHSFLIDNLRVCTAETVAFTDKKMNVITRETLTTYPNDVTEAGNVACVDDGEQEIIGTAVDTEHYRTKSVTGDASTEYTVSGTFSIKDKSIVRYTNDTTGLEAYVDLDTGLAGTVDSGLLVVVSPNGEWTKVSVSEVMASGANTVGFGAADTDNDSTYTGDGTTVDLLVKDFYAYTGGAEQNVLPYDNGASTYPRTLSVEPQDDPALKHAAGYLKTIDGAWVPLSEVDGLLMDENPAAVAYMQQNGLYKAVATGAWGPLVAGIQFYANNGSGNFVELFEGSTVTLTATNAIATNGDAGDDSIIPVRVVEGWIDDGDGVAMVVQSYATTAFYATVVPSNGSAVNFSLLVGSSFVGSDNSYSFQVEYKYGPLSTGE